MTDVLADTTAAWGLPLSTQQREQFARYAQELQRWNERLNLTAIIDPQQITTRHFLDSLRCALSWGPTPQRLIDIGAGAGFPGLPLKLLYPDLELTLVESVEKKAAFLRHVVELLGLTDVQVIVARAEALGRQPPHREQYDVVVARAVAELRVLAEYCLPLCMLGGRFLAPKGPQISAEVEHARAAITTLGGNLMAVETVQLPGEEPRSLVVIEKIGPTPAQYPRAIGIPAKRPL